MHKSYYTCDRFIQSNSAQVTANYCTKQQLFEDETSSGHSESRFNVNNSDNSQENLQEEENRKTYTALLQNQVLGVHDSELLREIHNRDEKRFAGRPFQGMPG